MKLLRLIFALLLLFFILFYTQETIELGKLVFKTTGSYIRDLYSGIEEEKEQGTFHEIEKDLEDLKEKFPT